MKLEPYDREWNDHESLEKAWGSSLSLFSSLLKPYALYGDTIYHIRFKIIKIGFTNLFFNCKKVDGKLSTTFFLISSFRIWNRTIFIIIFRLFKHALRWKIMAIAHTKNYVDLKVTGSLNLVSFSFKYWRKAIKCGLQIRYLVK